MNRFLFLVFGFFFFSVAAEANHLTGGEISYTYIGRSGNILFYKVRLKLLRDCESNGQPFNPRSAIAVYNKRTFMEVWSGLADRSRTETQSLGDPGPCVTNPPVVCLEVAYYEVNIEVPVSADGYIIAYNNCCRLSGLANLHQPTPLSRAGATYIAEIGGTSPLADGYRNNSPVFSDVDTVLVCNNNLFNHLVSATDADGDSLVYSFAEALSADPNMDGRGSNPDANGGMGPVQPPPFMPILYKRGFNADIPLGAGATIDPATGLISGQAPPNGKYIVTVEVKEYRNGVQIGLVRKDFQVRSAPCEIAQAGLKPFYTNCYDFTMNFKNLSNSPQIVSYYWDFGDPASVNDNSTLASPTYTYPAPGTYIVKLVVNRGLPCADSITTEARIYPGFKPGFTVSGACLGRQTQFTDTTRFPHGSVVSWKWDFGDIYSGADYSTQQNPTWLYDRIGIKNPVLIVVTDKGCRDTVRKAIEIAEKPKIVLPFRDTLICIPDNLQLQATGVGNFSWTPLINIVNANTATPIVNPTATTTYYVKLEDLGCENIDSVRVRVVDHVTLSAMNDSTICLTDTIQLRTWGDGLKFQWSPSSTILNPNASNPFAIPNTSVTNYHVIASIGSCIAQEDIVVTSVPYPLVNAGADTIICYNTPAQLNGHAPGPVFNWTPTNGLSDPNILNPVALPPLTRDYVLWGYENLGCPKPGKDTVTVYVRNKLHPFAGRDTAVVVGQSLQFNASGGTTYSWSPATGLSNTNTATPVGNYTFADNEIRYKLVVTEGFGCKDSAFVNVRVFKTNPTVFVPTAFTPDGDGRNDHLLPIAVGVKEIKKFTVYNRWGQLMFSTSVNGQGWDGKINGSPQGTNVYIWYVEATDFTGKPVYLKGTSTLIR